MKTRFFLTLISFVLIFILILSSSMYLLQKKSVHSLSIEELENYTLLCNDLQNGIYLIITVTLFFLVIGYIVSIYLENFFKKILLLKKAKSDNILFNSVLNSTNDLIFYKDKDYKYIGCNKAFEKFVGRKSAEIIGKDDFELFDKEHAMMFRQMDDLVLKNNKIRQNNEWVDFANGKKVYLQTQKIPFDYDKTDNIGILGISRDITDLYLAQKKIKEQSYIDELTKVYNRKAFNKKIKEKFDLFYRYNTQFCVAMYDIDDFKKINDEFGHDIGDKVLIQMSQKIEGFIRKTDTHFRVGGEEFMIIFPTPDLDSAYSVVEKIRHEISKMRMIEDRMITISFGLTKVNKNDTVDTIYKRVDELLYKSKNSGKNRTTKG